MNAFDELNENESQLGDRIAKGPLWTDRIAISHMASLSTFKPYELYNTVNYHVKVLRARSLPKKRAARPFTQHPSDPMGQMYPRSTSPHARLLR